MILQSLNDTIATSEISYVLAGCNTVNKGTAPGPTSTTQASAAQGASVDVFMASNTPVNGYRPVRINNQTVIYVSQSPVINRSHIRVLDIAKDTQNRTYVKLTLNPQGVALLNAAPRNMGYVTAVGGQMASLTGVRQGNDFLFAVRDQQVANAIVSAIVPKRASR